MHQIRTNNLHVFKININSILQTFHQKTVYRYYMASRTLYFSDEVCKHTVCRHVNGNDFNYFFSCNQYWIIKTLSILFYAGVGRNDKTVKTVLIRLPFFFLDNRLVCFVNWKLAKFWGMLIWWNEMGWTAA